MLFYDYFLTAHFENRHCGSVAAEPVIAQSSLCELGLAGRPGVPGLALDIGGCYFPALDDPGLSPSFSGKNHGLRMGCFGNCPPDRPRRVRRQLPPPQSDSFSKELDIVVLMVPRCGSVLLCFSTANEKLELFTQRRNK